MSPAPYAASNSNGTLNPTLHTGGTVLPSTRPQRTNDLTLQTISSVNQVVLGNIWINTIFFDKENITIPIGLVVPGTDSVDRHYTHRQG